MKKTFTLFTLFATLLISCESKKSNEQIIKENVENKLKANMKNPKSYEFVNMIITDTFTVKERRKITGLKNLEEIRELSTKIDTGNLLPNAETEYNFLNKQKDENSDAIYYVKLTARGTNSFGAITTNTYSTTVLNDDKLTVLNVSE